MGKDDQIDSTKKAAPEPEKKKDKEQTMKDEKG